jgi:hypothetical protein
VLAPVIAHIVLHWQLTLRGNEMPPAARARLESPDAGRKRLTESPAPERELFA